MSVSILGIKIDTLAKKEAIDRAKTFLCSSGQYRIWTPNPEMVVKAQKDEYFKTALNKGDLNLCDGFGLWVVVNEKTRKQEKKKTKVERITGVDFMMDLCEVAAEEGGSVYLLGSGSDDVVCKTRDVLLEKFPKLNIVGVSKGIEIEEISDRRYAIGESAEPSDIAYRLSPMKLSYDTVENEKLIAEVNHKSPSILFVAFGMGKQEKWIHENLPKMPSVKIAMGVGGAFDYISGIVPRAPRLMRQFGLEWLYRVVKQPARAGRIWNATFKFLWLVTTK